MLAAKDMGNPRREARHLVRSYRCNSFSKKKQERRNCLPRIHGAVRELVGARRRAALDAS